MRANDKTPVVLLTGFLGSGKTTFLNRLLATDAFKNSLVVVNEFGSVGIDHHLVEESADTLLELSNGCACCSVRGELVDTLASQSLDQFDRIIIETTGIADPMPIFQSLAFHPVLSRLLKPASIVTVFDTFRGGDLVKQHVEAVHQLRLADTIVLTKTDMPDAADNPSAQSRVFNDTAKIIESSESISPDELETTAISKTKTTPLDHHSSAYHSTILTTDMPISVPVLSGFLHTLANQLGERLLRVKGFAAIEGDVSAVAVQVSGNIVHDFVPLEEKPDGIANTQLVVITKGIKPELVHNLFSGFSGKAMIDTPDREALTNNPLAVPGF